MEKKRQKIDDEIPWQNQEKLSVKNVQLVDALLGSAALEVGAFALARLATLLVVFVRTIMLRYG